MDESLRDRLLKDVKKTGYPIELQVGDIFSRNGWNVQYNRYYLDREEQKGKEIDISSYVARSEKSAQPNIAMVSLHIICEVKKSSEEPWVVFSTKRQFTEGLGWGRLHYSQGVDHNILPYDMIERSSTLGESSRFGRSYHEGFKQSSDHSQIFKALISTIKACEDCLAKNQEALSRSTLLDKQDKLICFIEPMVVVDGLLYECYLSEHHELELDEIGYIPVSCGYISSEYVRRDHLVDVVTIKELPNLLEFKRKWIDDMCQGIVKAIHKTKK
jgi:hypothetical protein